MGRNIGLLDITSDTQSVTLALRSGHTRCVLAHAEVRVLIRLLEQAIATPLKQGPAEELIRLLEQAIATPLKQGPAEDYSDLA